MHCHRRTLDSGVSGLHIHNLEPRPWTLRLAIAPRLCSQILPRRVSPLITSGLLCPVSHRFFLRSPVDSLLTCPSPPLEPSREYASTAPRHLPHPWWLGSSRGSQRTVYLAIDYLHQGPLSHADLILDPKLDVGVCNGCLPGCFHPRVTPSVFHTFHTFLAALFEGHTFARFGILSGYIFVPSCVSSRLCGLLRNSCSRFLNLGTLTGTFLAVDGDDLLIPRLSLA